MRMKHGGRNMILLAAGLAAVVLISYKQPPLSYLGGRPGQGAGSKGQDTTITFVAPVGLFRDVSFKEVEKGLGKNVAITEFSNSQILERLSQSVLADLVAFRSDYAHRIFSRGLIQRFDTERVKNIATSYLDLPYARWAGYKIGSGPAYAVPYVVQMNGILLKSEFAGSANTWDMFWDSRFRGRIGGVSRDDVVYLAAVHSNVNLSSFGDNSESTLRSITPACAKLIANGVRFYDNVPLMLKDLESGRLDAVMVDERAAQEFTGRRTGFSFVEPKQGMVAFVYSLCVPVRAKNVEQSYAIANSLLAPQFAADLYRRGIGLLLVAGIEDQLNQNERSEYARELKSFRSAIVYPSLNMDAQQAFDKFVESLRASGQ